MITSFWGPGQGSPPYAVRGLVQVLVLSRERLREVDNVKCWKEIIWCGELQHLTRVSFMFWVDIPWHSALSTGDTAPTPVTPLSVVATDRTRGAVTHLHINPERKGYWMLTGHGALLHASISTLRERVIGCWQDTRRCYTPPYQPWEKGLLDADRTRGAVTRLHINPVRKGYWMLTGHEALLHASILTLRERVLGCWQDTGCCYTPPYQPWEKGLLDADKTRGAVTCLHINPERKGYWMLTGHGALLHASISTLRERVIGCWQDTGRCYTPPYQPWEKGLLDADRTRGAVTRLHINPERKGYWMLTVHINPVRKKKLCSGFAVRSNLPLIW